MLKKSINLFFIISFINDFAKALVGEECIFQDSCESCLSANINCAWCSDKHYEFRYRCLTQDQLLERGCRAAHIYENQPEMHLLTNAPLKDFEQVGDHAVQVQPQKIKLKLVKSNTQRIKLNYRPARNNPLDLYVLMDLTWTMQDDQQTLVKLGTQLNEALNNLTPNYRVGFGSFADKPEMPMIKPHLRENPCASEHAICEPTYGFKHRLSLTENTTEFVHSVKNSRVTGNLDNLEGGLDALMQVIVCAEQIGWKIEARKVVILATDGYMHFAGDGKLAGITQRNDKQCHLSAQGDYLGSLLYDYPSLEEIYRELLKRKVTVIFAVTKQVVSTYREMSNLMQEISAVEVLTEDSSNILDLIKKSYESLIKRTQFTDDSPDFIKLEYETDCAGQFQTLRRRNYCNDVQMGSNVEFYINITLTEFPKDGIYLRKIRIEESSLNEFMEIEVEIQHACPCEEPHEPADEYGRLPCTDNGYLQCGMCRCDEGWTGTFCSCATGTVNASTNEGINNLCRQQFTKPAELGAICSDRGECECGICECFPGYMGKYCQCPQCDLDCDLERADCDCGKCKCKPGWSGEPSCSCTHSLESCLGPTNEICSNRGNCVCGSCRCDEDFRGNFCEITSDTENKLCTFYEPCVKCLIEQQQGAGRCENLTDVCSSARHNTRFNYKFVSELEENSNRCLVRFQNVHGETCDHYFTYENLELNENYLQIQANVCEPVSYFAIFGTIALSTLLLGLLLICLIRYLISRKDKQEFARFENDQRNSILNESPLYKDPITRHEVPSQINEVDRNPFL